MPAFAPRPPARPRQVILGPTDSRNPTRRKAHGLTVAEQDALFARQGFRCAVCRRSGLPLQIDHDHRIDPGKMGSRASIRGALCQRCNSALGWIGDANIPYLLRYLTQR